MCKHLGKLPFTWSWYLTSSSLRDKGSTWWKWSQVRVYSNSDVFVCSVQAAVFLCVKVNVRQRRHHSAAEWYSFCLEPCPFRWCYSPVGGVHIFTDFHTRISGLVSVSRKNWVSLFKRMDFSLTFNTDPDQKLRNFQTRVLLTLLSRLC